MVDAKLFVCSNASGKSDYHFIKTNSSNPKLRFNIRITANENKPQRNIRFEYPNDIWSILDGPYNMVLWVK